MKTPKTAEQVNTARTGKAEPCDTCDERTDCKIPRLKPSKFCDLCRQQIRAEVIAEIEKHSSTGTLGVPYQKYRAFTESWWQEFKRGVAQKGE